MSPTNSPDDEPLFDPRITSYEWPIGIFGGLISFLAGYVAMVGIVLATGTFGSGTSWTLRIKTIGLIFYNAHQIPIAVDSPVPLIGGSSQNILTQGSPSLPLPVYYAVPVVAILVVSIGVASLTLERRAEIGEYAMPGLALTVGYLLTAILSRFAVSISTQLEGGVGTATQIPNLPLTLVFGLLYPLLVGLVGSMAVGAYRNRDDLRRRLRR